MLFGQNAARHIYNQDADWYKKTDSWLTIPKVIKMGNPAYRTAHFGKWHIGMEPGKAGFDKHDAMLKDLDTGIGQILDFVQKAGIADRTYIVLMGDNGGRATLNQIALIDSNKQLERAYYSEQHDRNYPLRDGKHSFYEGGLRVPFMIMGPDIKAGRVSSVPVTGLDLLPTFAAMSGYTVPLPDYIDGGNLLPLLTDTSIDQVIRPRAALIFHQGSHRKPRSAIRKGDYKLIKYWTKEAKAPGSPKVELYDLSKDLRENTDLAGQYPQKAEELEQELISFLKEAKAETSERDIPNAFYRLKAELGQE